jgi:diguanylate cyclase
MPVNELLQNAVQQLAVPVAEAKGLEELTRPVLAVLRGFTDMDAAYLTTIDTERDIQRIEYVNADPQTPVPEGFEVPWDDTLCKRALEGGMFFDNEIDSCWEQFPAAKQLNIRTYISRPLISTEGKIFGTLCAISKDKREQNESQVQLLELLTKLVALYLERELLVRKLTQQVQHLDELATIDHLTGIPNRRALFEHLEREIASSRRRKKPLLVSLIDLDNFKPINDTYGHHTGDLFLREVAQRLRKSLRADDFLGRFGGDEFMVISHPSANTEIPLPEQENALLKRLFDATTGLFDLEGMALTYQGASIGVVTLNPDESSVSKAIEMADRRMYEMKRLRRLAAALPSGQ